MSSHTPQTDYPLTSSQREIWFDQALHEDIALYNVGGYIRIFGPIDPALFEQAVKLLVQKHDALRTVLTDTESEDGLPLQSFVNTLSVSVPLQDFSEHDNAEQLAVEWMQARFNEAFELIGQPLFRYDLVKTSDTRYYWLMQYHHLIVDGHSIALLHHSLACIYTQLAQEQTPDLESPSYTHYIRDDRAYIESDKFEEQRRYWLKKYSTVPEPLLSPRYRSLFTNSLVGSGCEALYLPRDFYQQLDSLAKQHQATLPQVLLGALYVYFTRTAQSDNFTLGWPILNRSNAQFRQTAGLFVSISPILFSFDQNLSFAELLAQILKTLRANYRYQRFPISELNREVGFKTGHSKLFDISLSYQKFDYDTEFNGIKSYCSLLWQAWEQIPLIIHVQDFHAQSDVKLDFVYNLAYFTPMDIQALQNRLMTILQAVLADSSTLIYNLPILTESETRQLIEWNCTKTDYPNHQTIVTLFEEQVAKTPNHVAVVFENQQLTYRQLNDQANQLAHYLLQFKTPAGSRSHNPLMAIAVERSLEMVIGLLGILKAGGAYVPIDPSYPAAQIRYMLEDSAAPWLLTQSHLKAQLSLDKLKPDCVVVCLDEADFTKQPTENPLVNCQATDLAYVIYTSGSTGRPKGVCVPHRAVVRLVKNTNYALFDSEQTFLQYASISFDAATLEIWGALLHGAKLVVMPASRKSLEALAEVLQQENISVLWLTSSLFNLLLEEYPKSLYRVKQLLTGGEALSVSHIQKALRLLPETQLINGYGPTENTTFTCCYSISDRDYSNSIPIGRPIANTQVFIVDKNHQPLPVGIVGELITSGDGLARGYLNRPELTAEKFIEVELFGQTERIYKTGDLARWLSDGTIEYISRLDHQVKLRGFRIELGEIEATLRHHALVKETVLILSESGHSDHKKLVAYVVPQLDEHSAEFNQSIQEVSEAFITKWEELYNNIVYKEAVDDLAFNRSGWQSSCTREPIPAQEMRVWVDSTVATIQAWHPEAVLEMGCGVGLLLSRIAPHTRIYWGTDFSSMALQQVEQLKQRQPQLSHVVLKLRTADDFSGISSAQFDTVILNSVIQYFPSVDYLIKVLEQAINAIKPGGHLFVGDVRHLPLLHTYHASVQAWQATAEITQPTLRHRVVQQQLNDKELVIDPRLFIALSQQHPRVTGVKICPHRGLAHNELTRFRYQVILEIEHSASPASTTVDWQYWQPDRFSLDQLRQQLETPLTRLLGLRGVSNARLERENAIVEWLNNAPATETVGELRQSLATRIFTGLEPEALWQLGEELGYNVDIGWHNVNAQGHYEVLFNRRGADTPPAVFPIPRVNFKAWRDYANNPLHSQLSEKLIPQWREYLSERLPEYMIPSTFMLLDALPLTPNGKIDRHALPDPESAYQIGVGEYVPPRSVEEEILAQIWAEVLGLEQVDIHDNFFELGGHSLAAVQLLAKVKAAFGVQLNLQQIFDAPTVAEFADNLACLRVTSRWVEAPAPVSRANPLPITFFQEWFWRSSQNNPGSHLFHGIVRLRITGELDRNLLQNTLVEIVHRHELLRTTYREHEGLVEQIIHAEFPVSLPLLDAMEIPGEQQVPMVNEWLREFLRQPFVPQEAPPWRATLIQLARDEFILAICLHHLIYDARSLQILSGELQTIYSAWSHNQSVPLEPLPMQYADYAYWERHILAPYVADDCLAYWREWFARGLPPKLVFSTQRSVTDAGFSAGVIPWKFSPANLRSLSKVLKATNITPPLALIAAIATLLHQDTGEGDIVIGLPFADSTYSIQERLIGPTGRFLMLRLDLSSNSGFRELLYLTRRVFLEAQSRQFMTILEGIQKLGIQAKPGEILFHFLLSYIPLSLSVAGTNLPAKKVKFDVTESLTMVTDELVMRPNLSLVIQEQKTPEGIALKGNCFYRKSWFENEDAQSLVKRLQTLLEAASNL
ncbi:tubC protein [Thioploca ingrica]|uniref:TubC protein n=1 Tax=Thioploca ingrica TaxID=40754 RepID=A0A090ANR4_9GAMM|nr:tubC protein [Thioploca ingrica]